MDTIFCFHTVHYLRMRKKNFEKLKKISSFKNDNYHWSLQYTYIQINKKAICILFIKHGILCSLQDNKDEYIKQAIQCFRMMKIYRQINDSGRVGRKVKITLKPSIGDND